ATLNLAAISIRFVSRNTLDETEGCSPSRTRSLERQTDRCVRPVARSSRTADTRRRSHRFLDHTLNILACCPYISLSDTRLFPKGCCPVDSPVPLKRVLDGALHVA